MTKPAAASYSHSDTLFRLFRIKLFRTLAVLQPSVLKRRIPADCLKQAILHPSSSTTSLTSRLPLLNSNSCNLDAKGLQVPDFTSGVSLNELASTCFRPTTALGSAVGLRRSLSPVAFASSHAGLQVAVNARDRVTVCCGRYRLVRSKSKAASVRFTVREFFLRNRRTPHHLLRCAPRVAGKSVLVVFGKARGRPSLGGMSVSTRSIQAVR